jgi:F-box interacting protein
MLPPLENPRKTSPTSLYSFGYDHFIDNYKIIVISRCNNKNEVSVHTLGTDYWRRIDDFPYSGYICYERRVTTEGLFVSGTVNWLVTSGVIISLDLDKESYQKILLPASLKVFKDYLTLGVVRDCLCIFSSSKMFLDVWIMKEYGNKESWTKLYSVPKMRDRDLYRCEALYIHEDDRMLLMQSFNKLVVYDSKNGTSNIAEIQNINPWMHPQVYIESLISPCF